MYTPIVHLTCHKCQRGAFVKTESVRVGWQVSLHQHERNLPLGKVIKPFLRAAY
jgi:hypothetical protein